MEDQFTESENKFEKLKAEILRRSIAKKDFLSAKRMWDVVNIEKLDEPETCLCTKDGITERYTLEHRRTRKSIFVGNVCGKMFTSLDDIDGNELRSALNDLGRNGDAIPNLALIEYAQWSGFLRNDEEYNFLFCINEFGNSLFYNQTRKLRELNRRILDKKIVRPDLRDENAVKEFESLLNS